MTHTTTACDVLRDVFDELAATWRAYVYVPTRKEICAVLEDGEALAGMGFTDDDQEIIEEAHRLASKTAAEIIEEARKALYHDSASYSIEEIKAGIVIGCTVEAAYVDHKQVFEEVAVSTAPTDGELAADATPEEVQALINHLIESAIEELKHDLTALGIN